MKGGLIVVAGMYLVGFLWIVRTRGACAYRITAVPIRDLMSQLCVVTQI